MFYYLTIEESLQCLAADPLNSLRVSDRQPGQRSVFLESHGMDEINSKLNAIVRARHLPEESLNPVHNPNNLFFSLERMPPLLQTLGHTAPTLHASS